MVLTVGKRLMQRGALSCLRANALSTDASSGISHRRIYNFLRSVGTGSVHLSKTDDSPIATVTISNPKKRNALSGRMMTQLSDIVDELESWDSGIGVVLKGEGDFFCSGADLDVARTELSTAQAGKDMCVFMQDTLSRWRRLPLISVAAIRGGAVGGGTELAVSCDFRVMEENAMWQMVHARLGLSPGWGGGVRTVKLVGRRHALKLLAASEKVEAKRALEMGLIDEVAMPGRAANVAESLLAPFLSPALSVSGVKAAKKVVASADDLGTMDEALKNEAQLFSEQWSQVMCPET